MRVPYFVKGSSYVHIVGSLQRLQSICKTQVSEYRLLGLLCSRVAPDQGNEKLMDGLLAHENALRQISMRGPILAKSLGFEEVHFARVDS